MRLLKIKIQMKSVDLEMKTAAFCGTGKARVSHQWRHHHSVILCI